MLRAELLAELLRAEPSIANRHFRLDHQEPVKNRRTRDGVFAVCDGCDRGWNARCGRNDCCWKGCVGCRGCDTLC